MCYLPSLIKSLLTLHLTGRVAEVPGEGKSLVEAHKTSKKYNQKVNSGSGQPDPKVQPFPLEHIPSPGKHGASSSRNCLLEICPTLAGHGGSRLARDGFKSPLTACIFSMQASSTCSSSFHCNLAEPSIIIALKYYIRT